MHSSPDPRGEHQRARIPRLGGEQGLAHLQSSGGGDGAGGASEGRYGGALASDSAWQVAPAPAPTPDQAPIPDYVPAPALGSDPCPPRVSTQQSIPTSQLSQGQFEVTDILGWDHEQGVL